MDPGNKVEWLNIWPFIGSGWENMSTKNLPSRNHKLANIWMGKLISLAMKIGDD
jgi:hypothetical protein